MTKLFLLRSETVSATLYQGYSCNQVYLRESFPLILGPYRKCSPLFSNDLRYLGIGKSWMLCYNSGLVMLAIEYKSYPSR